MSHMNTLHFTVLVNGKPAEWFTPTRGIRQATLVALSFILRMEYFSLSIKQVVVSKTKKLLK